MKKLILIIVEGSSDKAYLLPIKKLVKKQFNKKIEFQVTKGDILTDSSTNSRNVLIKIGTTVQDYLETFKLSFSDIKQIIHIVDMDGVYINNFCIENDETLEKGKTVYYRDKITNVDRNNVTRRNRKKSACLDILCNTDSIEYGTYGTIPYRVYYFSTNIDDYFFGKQNSNVDEKTSDSDLIYDRYIDNPEEYRRMIEENYCVSGNYIETWEYIKEDNNSLSRCTNFDKFFTDIIDKL